MYKKIRFNGFLVFIVLLIGSFFFVDFSFSESQPENQGEEGEPFSVSVNFLKESDIQLTPGLKKVFNEIRTAAQKKETIKINDGILDVIEIKKKLDTNNFFPASDYLIMEASRMALQKNFRSAHALVEGAGEVSPQYSRVDFERASILFQENPKNILQSIKSLAIAVQKTLLNGAERSEVMVEIISRFLFVITLSFFFFFAFLLLLNIRPLIYDLRSFTPLTYAIIPSSIFAVSILFLPAAIGGIKFFLLTIPVFLWGYLGLQSRSIVVLFFLYLVLIFPQSIERYSKEAVYANSSIYQSLERVRLGNWDHEILSHFKEELNRKNPTPHAYFTLGYIYKKKGDYDQAISNYKKYLELFPGDALTLSNLGATYLELKKYKTAIDYFNKALGENPNLTEAHLNLNQAYTEILDTQNAKMEYDKAVQLNSLLTIKFMEESSRGENRGNIDCLLPLSRVNEYLDDLNKKVDLYRRSIWRSVVGFVSYNSFIYYVGGMLLILFAFYFYKKKSGYSHVCLGCGNVFTDPFQLSEYTRERCFQCSAFSSRKQIIDPKKKKELQLKISHYQNKKRKLELGLNLLFPGSGFIYAGKGFIGFSLTVVNSLFIVAIVFALLLNRMVEGEMPEFLSSNLYMMGSAFLYYTISLFISFMRFRNS